MYIEKSIPHRQKDEKLILFLRRHPIALAGRWALLLVLIIIPIGIIIKTKSNAQRPARAMGCRRKNKISFSSFWRWGMDFSIYIVGIGN